MIMIFAARLGTIAVFCGPGPAEAERVLNSKGNVRMNQEIVKKSFVKTLPVLAGYVVLGTGFGILMRNAGYGVAWAAAMSIFMYAGAGQYIAVGLFASGASLAEVFIAELLVNIRHIVYGLSLIDKFRNGLVKRIEGFTILDFHTFHADF